MGQPETGADRRYLALIGDIRRSRHIKERGRLQQVLEDALKAINSRFKEEVAAQFVLTLGDEFQGLLKEPESVVRVLVALEGMLEGTEVRYGLGWGELSTQLQDVALRTDGPCFHKARAAIMTGKHDDRWVTAAGFGADDVVLNGLFRLMGDVRWEWTDTQRKTVELMRRADTQKEVAQARGVSISAVSKTLRAATYEPLLEAERAVAVLLERHVDGGDITEVNQ